MRHLPLILAALLFAIGLGRDAADRWVEATVLPPLGAAHSVEVTGQGGTLLRAFTVEDGRWRLKTSLDAVSPLYLDMLLAYEDKRFRAHGGVDPRAAARAAWQALRHGRVVSGASTLTMQAARLIENSGTGAWPGKRRQVRLALALERRLGKDEILSLYLNHAPFGGNIEGLRAATRAWFGKDPVRLTPAEAALLVALPQSPETRRPDRFPEAARAARDRVLSAAHAAGVIDDAALRVALAAPVPVAREPVPALAPHLTARAQATRPGADVHRLTIDPVLQARLETRLAEAITRHDRHVTAAAVVADHTTGAILAHVGNAAPESEARRGWVDMTVAARSPGSTLKPLVYALSFDAGLAHPETLIEDRPARFGTYQPVNFDGDFLGTMRVREALMLSRNLPVIRLAEALGPSAILAGLRRAGAEAQVPGGVPGLAVALGGVGVTLEDLATLYAGLAQGGVARPLFWREGEGSGAGKRIVSPVSAWQIGHILSGIAPPEGAADLGIAYKTGTSYGHRDAWAAGYDGRHVVVVWLGRADGTPVPGAFGADTAAPILFDIFAGLGPVTPLPPPPPETLLVANADLPLPLRRFGAREDGAEGPDLAFPPDGAVLEAGELVPARVRDGTPPFTWLAEGVPVLAGSRAREVLLPLASGPLTLSVVDAAGRAARAEVTIQRP